MKKTFGQVICVDECPIVRRAAAPVLSKLIEIIKTNESKGKKSDFSNINLFIIKILILRHGLK